MNEVQSSPVIDIAHLSKWSRKALDRGNRVLTYLCSECDQLRSLEVVDAYKDRDIKVLCSCGARHMMSVEHIRLRSR